MISAIRNKFGSKLLDFFIWISIIVFVGLYLIPSKMLNQKTSEWAISANDEILPYNEYKLILDHQKKLGNRGENKQKEIIDALTTMLLMQSLENKMNIVIKPAAINAKLQKILPGVVGSDGVIDLEQLRVKLSQEGLPQSELDGLVENLGLMEKQIRQELKNEVVNHVLLGSLYLPKFVLQNYCDSEYALKQFAILKASYAKYHHEIQKHKIEDSTLKAFFDQQNIASKRYWTTELRSGVVWSFTPANFDIKVTEQQIKAYYERNRRTEFVKQAPKIQIRRILLKEQELAGKVRADLANDASRFEELAKTYSEDKPSAAKGGLMDFMAADEMEPTLANAAFELRADGEISEVIETSKGFEIIQRVSKGKVEFKTLEEVRTQIVQKLTNQQFERLFPINARRIIAESGKNPEALAKFVASKKGTKKQFDLVAIDNDKLEISKLYELKKVDQKLFLMNSGAGEIIVLTALEPAKVQDFEKIKHTVLADYQKSMTIKEIQKKLALAKEALEAGKDAKSVAHELGLEYEHTPLVNRLSTTAHKKNWPLELLWSVRMLGTIKAQVLDQGEHSNGYVVKMEQLEAPASEELGSKRGEAKLQLFGRYRNSLDQSFIASLRKNGTIKVNTAIINA